MKEEHKRKEQIDRLITNQENIELQKTEQAISNAQLIKEENKRMHNKILELQIIDKKRRKQLF